MSELENLSSNEKSEASADSSSSPLDDLVKEWQARAQTGTACKCGANASVPYSEGGREWLLGHVEESHAVAFDWLAAINKALAMPSDQGAEFLATLVKHQETKKGLGASNA